ncbi:hypothetical protein Bbelb_324770 [Branchiostoma belcheri]|nr:hypothetical protein Bbelb_324770 [Branchiostoma belcheri]
MRGPAGLHEEWFSWGKMAACQSGVKRTLVRCASLSITRSVPRHQCYITVPMSCLPGFTNGASIGEEVSLPGLCVRWNYARRHLPIIAFFIPQSVNPSLYRPAGPARVKCIGVLVGAWQTFLHGRSNCGH